MEPRQYGEFRVYLIGRIKYGMGLQISYDSNFRCLNAKIGKRKMAYGNNSIKLGIYNSWRCSIRRLGWGAVP